MLQGTGPILVKLRKKLEVTREKRRRRDPKEIRYEGLEIGDITITKRTDELELLVISYDKRAIKRG